MTAFTPENEHTEELLEELYKNAILYGFSLVVTAVIQTMQGQLDLYHAIFVMQIIFSLDFVYLYGAVGLPSDYRSQDADGIEARRSKKIHPIRVRRAFGARPHEDLHWSSGVLHHDVHRLATLCVDQR